MDISTIYFCYMVANSTKALKDRLKEVMKKREVKVPQLSEETHIPKDRIYKWYKEGTNPKADDAATLEKWIKGELNMEKGQQETKNPEPEKGQDWEKKYYALLEEFKDFAVNGVGAIRTSLDILLSTAPKPSEKAASELPAAAHKLEQSGRSGSFQRVRGQSGNSGTEGTKNI